jgi:hypothetical protein
MQHDATADLLSEHIQPLKSIIKNLKQDLFLPDTIWRLQEWQGIEGRLATPPGT